jgi:aspartyl-tRNA(Asn)/glutamyl-tRNA(Gln) amidotransferase subunit B
VRVPGQQELPNYKVEVKNINSFAFAEKAILYEIARQIEILKEGKTPKQVTMGWNEKTNATVEQRSKEEANDYRYFPEPDLPILHIDDEMQARLRAEIPELPAAKRSRFSGEYGLPAADIQNLVEWKALTEFFEEAVSELLEVEDSPANVAKLAKMAANWCLQDFSALLNAAHMEPADSRVTAGNFAELIKLIDQGKVSVTAGKQVLVAMFETGGEPLHIVEDLGLAQVSDAGVIEAAVAKVIAEQPKAAADYRAGQEKSFGFLVGMAMKELKGKGNPQVVNEALKKQLGR